MASVSEPEVQFAQKLASNEKPLRKKALKKLRSYISARSRSQTGFSEEELLKLWKGLFYCLWMQDKPLLQEKLSTQISGLIYLFNSFNSQLLYLQTFMTTMQREWTGIDRLRMDKFFQLVRFMFRHMFEVLQRSQWEPSCISPFLEWLSLVLLQTGASPAGLQQHVLDLYLKELAVVGAQELTAEQNLTFIEPFCKVAAKTKDRSLFRAICNNIFSTIIDQAPFAIQELMEELEQDSDCEQASNDSDEPGGELKSRKTQNKNNGLKALSEEEDDDEEDEGLADTERPFDDDMGPVLQFDYEAVGDKLLQLSSRHNTPSRNRPRLYKIIKVLRDLSQGSFPQDEYPEEVSTDEDDEGFGSRKRMKKRRTEEEQGPEEKKMKKNNTEVEQGPEANKKNTEEEEEEPEEKKKKKKQKKKKRRTEVEQGPEEKKKKQTEREQEPEEEKKKNTEVEQELEEEKNKNTEVEKGLEEKKKQTEVELEPEEEKKKNTEVEKGLEEKAKAHKTSEPTVLHTSEDPKPTALHTSEDPEEQSDFVSFKSSSPPAPLFCKVQPTKKKSATPKSGTKKKSATPKSDTKKVRFGLKNNQTAEFRKSDRSLMLSPEGTNCVPFDPDQKPKCGVLKSPPTPILKQKKKKKSPLVRTQKKKTARPSASDFF